MVNSPDDNDQAFLLKLSDTLRSQAGVEAVGNRATQLIADQLGADRVYLVFLNHDDHTVVVTHEARRQDMPPLRNTYRSSDFPAAIQEIVERTITTLNLLFPIHTYQPKAILKGFYQFCYEHRFTANVIHEIERLVIQPGHAYINLMEEDLVTVVKKTKSTGYAVGKDIGILSYNKTPLKEILLDGITVMSTDFDRMGRTAADLINRNEGRHLENPFRLIPRKSL